MKTKNQTVTAPVINTATINQTTAQAVLAYLTEAIKGKESGEVTLDEISQRLPGRDRYEIVSELRKIDSIGKFFVGRRGRKSRFCWGKNIETQPIIHAPRPKQAKTDGMGIILRIGGIEKFLPLEMELVRG